MKKINQNWFEFSSGNTVYVQSGIIGLDPDDKEVCLCSGSDGTIFNTDGSDLSPQDTRELAEAMIAAWTKIKDGAKD